MGWEELDPVVEQPPTQQPSWFSADPVAQEQSGPARSVSEQITGDPPQERKFLGPVASSIVRPPVLAASQFLLPADAFQGVRNLTMGTNYEHPSAALERLLNKYTTQPEGWGKVAEFGSSTLLGSKGLPRFRTSAPQVQRPPSSAPEVIKSGEKHDVRVFYDDVAGSPMAEKIGAIFEQLGWLGTGGGRAKQAADATRAMERELYKFGPGITEEVPVLVQQGLRRRLASFRKTADIFYRKAATLLDPAGLVPTPKFHRELNLAFNDETLLGDVANKGLLRTLKAIKYGFPPGNFSHYRKLRSRLGSLISEYYTGKNTTIGKDGAQYLQRMKDAIEHDMEAFAKQYGTKNPDAYEAWKKADGYYKANIVPFKEAGFKDLVNAAEPEKAWRYLLTEGGVPSRMRRMYRSLDEQGRAAVRYGLVKDAYQHALVPAKAGRPQMASPAKFAKYLEDHAEVIDNFFVGTDRAEINGFRNLMRHVERAGQYMENPPTGNRLGILFLLSSPAWISAGGTTRLLFQTKRGRDLLLKMSRAKPGSQSERAIGESIGRYVVSAWAIHAGRDFDSSEGSEAQ